MKNQPIKCPYYRGRGEIICNVIQCEDFDDVVTCDHCKGTGVLPPRQHPKWMQEYLKDKVFPIFYKKRNENLLH